MSRIKEIIKKNSEGIAMTIGVILSIIAIGPAFILGFWIENTLSNFLLESSLAMLTIFLGPYLIITITATLIVMVLPYLVVMLIYDFYVIGEI